MKIIIDEIIHVNKWWGAHTLRLFSQRNGLKPDKIQLQRASMDDELRNKIWSGIHLFYWSQVDEAYPYRSRPENKDIGLLMSRLWMHYYTIPLDELDNNCIRVIEKIRKSFFNSTWNEVYDFLEFISHAHPSEELNKNFTEFTNQILEDERSAYRFVNGTIAEITSEAEIASVKESTNTPIDAINEHYSKALSLLSDKKKPDYPNSMKESMMGVEATCKYIARDDSADLHKALKIIEKKYKIHGALKSALDSLYGYASDASGIRHAKISYDEVDYDTAKFFLVMCSSFTNYLLSKKGS